MGRKYIIGDTGYSFITAEWVPDPVEISQSLLRMSDAVDDWSVPMQEAKTLFASGVRHRFETETDPYGTPWPELNPEYAAQKERNYPGQTILRRTDELFFAATNTGSYTIDANGKDIFFDSGGLPFYAGYHQEGLSERKNPLPRRQFIGIDDEDAGAIALMFEEWLDVIVDEEWVPYRVGQNVLSSKGFSGTFTGIHAIGGAFTNTFLVRGFHAGHFVPGTVEGGHTVRFRSRGGRFG